MITGNFAFMPTFEMGFYRAVRAGNHRGAVNDLMDRPLLEREMGVLQPFAEAMNLVTPEFGAKILAAWNQGVLAYEQDDKMTYVKSLAQIGCGIGAATKESLAATGRVLSQDPFLLAKMFRSPIEVLDRVKIALTITPPSRKKPNPGKGKGPEYITDAELLWTLARHDLNCVTAAHELDLSLYIVQSRLAKGLRKKNPAYVELEQNCCEQRASRVEPVSLQSLVLMKGVQLLVNGAGFELEQSRAELFSLSRVFF